jgi:hypothetical protein
MMSGSQKYVVGAPLGEKSRGGLVTVLGGATGAPCAAAVPVPATIAPAPAASAWTSVRRDNVLSSLSFSRSVTRYLPLNLTAGSSGAGADCRAVLANWQGTSDARRSLPGCYMRWFNRRSERTIRELEHAPP